MKSANLKKEKRDRRHKRIRSQVSGTAQTPRLSVFKSNKHIFAQLINDDTNVTLASVHSREVSGKTMSEKAVAVGSAMAEKALAKKISGVVFDRGGFMYAGNIKALADSARKSGLKF